MRRHRGRARTRAAANVDWAKTCTTTSTPPTCKKRFGEWVNGCWVSGRHGGINPMVRHYYSSSISIVAELRCNASPLGCWATTFRAGETICRRGCCCRAPAGGWSAHCNHWGFTARTDDSKGAGRACARQPAGAWSPQLKKSRCWRQEESPGVSCWLVVGLAPMSDGNAVGELKFREHRSARRPGGGQRTPRGRVGRSSLIPKGAPGGKKP